MIISFWLFKAQFPADDIKPQNVPNGALEAAKAGLSFRAHLRPISMLPPVLPVPQLPRRAAIPQLPLLTGARNPRFHQLGQMERLRSNFRPGRQAH